MELRKRVSTNKKYVRDIKIQMQKQSMKDYQMSSLINMGWIGKIK